MLKRWYIFFVAAMALVAAAPATAYAARGYATSSVHMRAGPSTQYPVVTTIGSGDRVNIHGCLSDHGWCDVSWTGNRGWVSADYLNYFYNNRYVYLPDYVGRIDVPVVTFALGSYWNRYYSGRPFYHRRAHWEHFWRAHGHYGHHRHGHNRHINRHAGHHRGHHAVINRPHRKANAAVVRRARAAKAIGHAAHRSHPRIQHNGIHRGGGLRPAGAPHHRGLSAAGGGHHRGAHIGGGHRGGGHRGGGGHGGGHSGRRR